MEYTGTTPWESKNYTLLIESIHNDTYKGLFLNSGNIAPLAIFYSFLQGVFTIGAGLTLFYIANNNLQTLQQVKPAATGFSFTKTFIALNVFLGFYVFGRI